MHHFNCVVTFLSSLMQWVQGLATGVSVFRDLSLSLSCPAHCGGSSVLSFLAGSGFGLCLGLLIGLYCLWISSWGCNLESSSAEENPKGSAGSPTSSQSPKSVTGAAAEVPTGTESNRETKSLT